MKTILRNLLCVTLPVLAIVLVLLEITFQFVVPASDPPMGWFDDQHKMYRFATDRETGLFTIGALAQQRGRWRINNAGWNSPIDYTSVKNRPRIAVIGDSYVEALQVDSEKSFPSVLRALLADKYDVYSFGISGAPLSQYLQIARYAVEQYDPDILIFTIIHNDFLESVHKLNMSDQYFLLINTDDARTEEVGPRADPSFAQFSLTKRILRHSALVRYLMLNLKIKRLVSWDQLLFDLEIRKLIEWNELPEKDYGANINPQDIVENRADVRLAVEYIFDRLRMEFLGRDIIVVMDAPRDLLYSGRANEEISFLHQLIEQVCGDAGFLLLDLTEPMRAAYAEDGIRFETRWDAHWNEYGNSFVARAVAEVLPARRALR